MTALASPPRSAAQARPAARRRGSASALAVAAMVMLGVAVLLYPAAASWFSQLEQSARVDAYTDAMEQLGPAGREQELSAARAYNETLTGGALIDPYGQTPLADQRAVVAAYEEQLDLGPADVMARVRIPSIGVDLPVYHGTDEATLRKGVGHLLGSALPVGGSGAHSVLTAHRGLPESVLFSDLDRVRVGDVFEVDVYGEALTYEVRDVQVIEPTDTDLLTPVTGRDLVSLVTCTPLGINSHRIIVTGERIATPVTQEAGPMAEGLAAPWWAVGLAAGWGLAAVYRTSSARSRDAAPITAAPTGPLAPGRSSSADA